MVTHFPGGTAHSSCLTIPSEHLLLDHKLICACGCACVYVLECAQAHMRVHVLCMCAQVGRHVMPWCACGGWNRGQPWGASSHLLPCLAWGLWSFLLAKLHTPRWLTSFLGDSLVQDSHLAVEVLGLQKRAIAVGHFRCVLGHSGCPAFV